MTAIPCPHCDRSCAGPAGLASHIRSLHPEVMREREARLDRDLAAVKELPVTDDAFTWADPPKRGRNPHVVSELVALIPRLQERPGSWARMRVCGSKSSANAVRAKVKDEPSLAGVEFSAHVHGEKGSALYGRWMGDAA